MGQKKVGNCFEDLGVGGWIIAFKVNRTAACGLNSYC